MARWPTAPTRAIQRCSPACASRVRSRRRCGRGAGPAPTDAPDVASALPPCQWNSRTPAFCPHDNVEPYAGLDCWRTGLLQGGLQHSSRSQMHMRCYSARNRDNLSHQAQQLIDASRHEEAVNSVAVEKRARNGSVSRRSYGLVLPQREIGFPGTADASKMPLAAAARNRKCLRGALLARRDQSWDDAQCLQSFPAAVVAEGRSITVEWRARLVVRRAKAG